MSQNISISEVIKFKPEPDKSKHLTRGQGGRLLARLQNDERFYAITSQTPMPSLQESLKAAIDANNQDVWLASDADKSALMMRELSAGQGYSDEQSLHQDADSFLAKVATEVVRQAANDAAKIDLDSVRVTMDRGVSGTGKELFILTACFSSYKPSKANT